MTESNSVPAEKSEKIQHSNPIESCAVIQVDYFRAHTYDEMSKEFREVFPLAMRAFELIPLMYNRLTLVDGLSHRAALSKIVSDHKGLRGFTGRSIRRNLPADNPNVPRRVRTSRPKNYSGQQSSTDALEKRSQDGFHSNLVEKFGNSKDYIKRLPDDMQKQCSSILDEYKHIGHIETQQYITLLQIYEKICFLKGKNSITNANESPPDGWIRPPCNICGGPLRGVVVDSNDNKGKSVLDHLRGWYHTACQQKVQAAKTKDNAKK